MLYLANLTCKLDHFLSPPIYIGNNGKPAGAVVLFAHSLVARIHLRYFRFTAHVQP